MKFFSFDPLVVVVKCQKTNDKSQAFWQRHKKGPF